MKCDVILQFQDGIAYILLCYKSHYLQMGLFTNNFAINTRIELVPPRLQFRLWNSNINRLVGTNDSKM